MILNIMIHTWSYVSIHARIRSDESYRPKISPRGISVGREERRTRLAVPRYATLPTINFVVFKNTAWNHTSTRKGKAVSPQTVLGSCISQSCPRAMSVTRFATLYAPYCVYIVVTETETEPLCRSKLSTRLIQVSSTISCKSILRLFYAKDI